MASYRWPEVQEALKHPQRRSKRKKKSAVVSPGAIREDELEEMAQGVRYRASPYHKSSPLAWGLSRPVPRADKTICEGSGITCCRDAAELLKSGIRRGMVSEDQRGGWPQNIWAVDAEGTVYEAQLSNRELGEYHGYPMKHGDKFAEFLLSEWERRGQ